MRQTQQIRRGEKIDLGSKSIQRKKPNKKQKNKKEEKDLKRGQRERAWHESCSETSDKKGLIDPWERRALASPGIKPRSLYRARRRSK